MANVSAKTAVMTASAYLVADRASAARNAEVTICEVTGAYITQYAFFADQQSALKRALTTHTKLKLPAPSSFETGAPKQIVMLSYGKERPAVLGDNEAAWAKNRRVNLIYEAK